MTTPYCIFCKIIAGEIPSDKVYEDDEAIAIKDINPAAETHILVIPKVHKSSLNEYDEADKNSLGSLLLKVKKIAHDLGVGDGYKTIINTGEGGGQTVFHLHIHLLAGKRLKETVG